MSTSRYSYTCVPLREKKVSNLFYLLFVTIIDIYRIISLYVYLKNIYDSVLLLWVRSSHQSNNILNGSPTFQSQTPYFTGRILPFISVSVVHQSSNNFLLRLVLWLI